MAFMIEISDGCTSQTRKLKGGVTRKRAEELLEEMWMADEDFRSYTLWENDTEICTFES